MSISFVLVVVKVFITIRWETLLSPSGVDEPEIAGICGTRHHPWIEVLCPFSLLLCALSHQWIEMVH